MRTCLSLVVASLLAGAVSAQATTTNEFDIYPNSTDAVSRAALTGTSFGDLLLQVRGRSFFPFQDTFAGLGDKNTHSPTHPTNPGSGLGTVDGFAANYQDQNGSTSEAFNFAVVAESTLIPQTPAVPMIGNPVGPDTLLRTSTLFTPGGQAGTPVGWIITAALATPADVLPVMGSYYFGSGLGSNVAWSADGLSVPMGSFGGLGSPFPNRGDNPVNGSANDPSTITWTRDITNGLIPTQSSNARAQDLRLMIASPIIKFGADIVEAGRSGPNPNWGMAGLAPDVCGIGNASRFAFYNAINGYAGRGGAGDGLALQVQGLDNIGATGTYLLTGIFALSGSPVYLNNPGFKGSIVIDLTVVIPFPMNGGNPVPPVGSFQQTLFPGGPGLCSFVGGGVLAVQGLLSGPGGNVFTNGAKTNF